MTGLDVGIRHISGSPGLPSSGLRLWFGTFPTAEGLFWCSVAGDYFFRTLFQLHEQERRAARLAFDRARLEASLNHAQLEVLRARLNPIFFSTACRTYPC